MPGTTTIATGSCSTCDGDPRTSPGCCFSEWFPQIVYNQHQAPPFPARIFVPPYAEPLNPDIPAAVMEGINLHRHGHAGSASRARDKPGVLSYFGFDAWWNGGLRSVPAFHNMHGILTETAGNSYATPQNLPGRDFPLHLPTAPPRASHPCSTSGRGWAASGACATPSNTCSRRTWRF